MQILENHLTVKKTARYYTLGELNNNTETIWFVLHGYGQLGQFFIKKFETLNDGKNFIVAPEALSKFYLNGVSGRVGATWMTREDRTSEIDDYVAYLNQLYDAILEQSTNKILKINLLAFSQGNATVMRWLDSDHVRCDKLILWAAFFGKGIADVIDLDKLKNIETHFVYGTQDEYLTQIDIPKYLSETLAEIPHAKITSFDGPHTVDVPTLHKILSA